MFHSGCPCTKLDQCLFGVDRLPDADRRNDVGNDVTTGRMREPWRGRPFRICRRTSSHPIVVGPVEQQVTCEALDGDGKAGGQVACLNGYGVGGLSTAEYRAVTAAVPESATKLRIRKTVMTSSAGTEQG